jgi:hypothetical protein
MLVVCATLAIGNWQLARCTVLPSTLSTPAAITARTNWLLVRQAPDADGHITHSLHANTVTRRISVTTSLLWLLLTVSVCACVLCVRSFDPALLQQQVSAARAAGPDLVVVFIHWGPNWRWQPDKALRTLGRAFLDAGADLVFGTSPHHLQVSRHGS